MMTPEQRQQARRRAKPAPEPRPVALVPVHDATLARMDALIEHLMELRDILDGDPDQEHEHHDGAAVFPGSPLYEHTDLLASVQDGPGDPQDAEAEPDEDGDEDEPSYIWVTTRSGRERMA
jgi:hypothetical protein